jgi:DNA-binding NarL/FixJ family response regulator
MTLTVLIADDHPLVRAALAHSVRALDAEVRVHEAQDFETLLALARAHDADLALVDLNMPGMNGVNGLSGLARLREAVPALPVVVASGQEDAATVRAVLAAGAAGFIPKSERPEALVSALRQVLAGECWVPQRLLDQARPSPTGGLTPRQLDVMRRLLCGEPNKKIAHELGLTEGTVKLHVAAILRTLQARNRTEAVVRARALGITPSFEQ